MRKRGAQRVEPLGDSGLAGIDLLTAANQAEHHRPVDVAIHAGEQELGLRGIEFTLALLSRHERRCLLAVPRALRFIEDRHVLRRGLRVDHAVIAKVMDVLDEGFDMPASHGLGHGSTGLAFAPHLIADQRLSQDRNQGSVAGQEHAIQRTRRVHVPRRDVQAHEGLAGSRYTGQQADDLAAFALSVGDHAAHIGRAACQIGGACIASRDLGD